MERRRRGEARAGGAAAVAAAAALAAGCFASHGPSSPDEERDAASQPVVPSPGWDAGPATAWTPGQDGGACDRDPLPGSTSALDLLFVIDDSPSMDEEQAALARRMPGLLEVLGRGDLDGDGTVDFPPVHDLHLAVVTTDMGVLGNDVDGCEEPHFGDDGRMDRAGDPDCRGDLPTFLSLTRDAEGGVSRLAADFSCLARVGTEGCGFEQPFEASLKALTRSTSGLGFHGDTPGHGDGANAGFLREGSMLAVVLVTDEDDCSAEDRGLFDGESYVYPEPLTVRCAFERRALHPLERFVHGLADLRPGHPERLFVGALVGVPVDTSIDGSSPGAYESLLDDARMQPRRAGESGATLVPSCRSEHGGEAYPPRRIVRALSQLAPRSAVASICAEGLASPLEALVTGLGRTIRADACLRRTTSAE